MQQKSNTIAGGDIAILSIRGRIFILVSVLVGLGVTIYGKSLYDLTGAVLQRHGSSHGLFVPLISGYIFWLKLDKIKRMTPQVALLPGVAMMAAGVLLLVLGRNSTEIVLPVLSFLLIAAGLILVFFGKEVFRELYFPLFFLATMTPLPEAAYKQIAEWMRQATTWGAVALIKPIGIPLHRDGFDIFLPNSHLHVGYSCSGVRYLLSYLVFGIAYAFRFKKIFTSRALMVMSAIPLSIVGGVLRLSIIFSSAYFIGPIMVEQRPHVLLSWSVFMVLLVGAIGVDRYLTGNRGQGSGGRGKG